MVFYMVFNGEQSEQINGQLTAINGGPNHYALLLRRYLWICLHI